MQVVERARREDLNTTVSYTSSFVGNKEGKTVFDRKYNTISLLKYVLFQLAHVYDQRTYMNLLCMFSFS